jgi:hypothetical protein
VPGELDVLGEVLAVPLEEALGLLLELLSRALFLHAASPISGTIDIMASNVFNDINSPPFFGLIAAGPLLSSLLAPGQVGSMRMFTGCR